MCSITCPKTDVQAQYKLILKPVHKRKDIISVAHKSVRFSNNLILSYLFIPFAGRFFFLFYREYILPSFPSYGVSCLEEHKKRKLKTPNQQSERLRPFVFGRQIRIHVERSHRFTRKIFKY